MCVKSAVKIMRISFRDFSTKDAKLITNKVSFQMRINKII